MAAAFATKRLSIGRGFNGVYWQDGWGYDDVCNVRKL